MVVYSGNGLIGYGELIIIKHSDKMLSAYAHNKVRLVNESDQVTAGQKIAEMGRNSGNEQVLHFEIRVHGKPVNPLRYLSKK
jgi:lipoprotein NlpD